MTDALLAAVLEIAEAEEERLRAMRRALVEGDEAAALHLLRYHLGLVEGDDAAARDRAAPSEHRGAGRA